jgi:hypothetical protein
MNYVEPVANAFSRVVMTACPRSGETAVFGADGLEKVTEIFVHKA